MKKLLLTALLAISPMTFAETISSDMVLGKWQCEAKFNYPRLGFKGTENYKTIYYNDGNHKQVSVINAHTSDFGKNMIEIKGRGKWYIKDNHLFENFEKIDHYQASNQAYEDYYQTREYLENDKSFSEYSIHQLSVDKIIFKEVMNDEDSQSDYNSSICQRIK
ncbi:hypothetical protein [Faucicola boevrei]|uniref:hypothetical protein n=1 Tax=Faucicola boevrei TaxID=346665 RepID=UPI000372540F|nr:hypothetical protein [Moraxella boevrei]